MQVLSKESILVDLKEAEAAEDIEIFDMDDSRVEYWDYVRGNSLVKYYPECETVESLKRRVFIEEAANKFINRDDLVPLMYETVDRNALCTMKAVYFVFDDEEGHSDIRDKLEEETGDEYAQYVAEDALAVTWVEQSTVVINVKQLAETSLAISEEPDEYHTYREIFMQGLASTMYHEFRHLLYECNELVELGSDYPFLGGTEEEVEGYGNARAEEFLSRWDSVVCKDIPVLEEDAELEKD